MITKHTPGPWHRNIRPAAKYPVVWSGRNKHVLAIKTVGLSQQEIEANMDLATAAPDLLAALQAEEEWRARDAAGALDPEWNYEVMVGAKRRAAIAKATGGAA